ncbi:MAG: BLUF domain-containing protein [Fuerstiella sp.]
MNNEPQGLHRLVYASVAATELKPDDLQSILESSDRNNARDEITGALVLADGYFLQYLEGDRRVLSDLLSRLYQDTRHSQINLVEFNRCSERQFSKWTMRHLEFDPDTLFDVLGTKYFRPMEWSADRSYAFFLKFGQIMETGLGWKKPSRWFTGLSRTESDAGNQ